MTVFILSAILVSVSLHAASAPNTRFSQTEVEASLQRIINNLDHPGITPGAIIASPTQNEPNYFFHWTRDAGLTVLTLMQQASNYPGIQKHVARWGRFERLAQQESLRGEGLGEPKFFVNGKVFDGPWGRPQNDGPAIRSLAYLRSFHKIDALVRADLDYTLKHWRDANIDLWEEVRGHHFFTRYSQMTFLRYAAVHYQADMDKRKAEALLREAAVLEQSLTEFVDRSRHIVVPTLRGSEGVQKPSGLDISVILAMNYFGTTPAVSSQTGSVWTYSQPYVMNTALQMVDGFKNLYEINKKFSNLAPAIGRYPEDVYDGNGFSGGNPWFLATYGMAEYYCALVQEKLQKKSLNTDALSMAFYRYHNPQLRSATRSALNSSQAYFTTLNNLMIMADSFIKRGNFHGGRDGRFAEQLDRNSGFQRGAQDLTWSYASRIRAYSRCQASEALLAKAQRSAR